MVFFQRLVEGLQDGAQRAPFPLLHQGMQIDAEHGIIGIHVFVVAPLYFRIATPRHSGPFADGFVTQPTAVDVDKLLQF